MWAIEGGPLGGLSYEYFDDLTSRLAAHKLSCDVNAARRSGSGPITDSAGQPAGSVIYSGPRDR